MKIFARIFCFAAAWLFCLPAHAENTQRLCAMSDLKGNFMMVDFREYPKGEENKWHSDFPYHYIGFNPDHSFDFVASRRLLDKEEERHQAYIQTESEGSRVLERKYTLDADGILNLYIDGKLDHSYRCMIVVKAAAGDHVGDLMLTGYSRRRAELYKLFRPVK